MSENGQTNLKSVIFGARTGKELRMLFGPEGVGVEVTEKARFIQPFICLCLPSKRRIFAQKHQQELGEGGGK